MYRNTHKAKINSTKTSNCHRNKELLIKKKLKLFWSLNVLIKCVVTRIFIKEGQLKKILKVIYVGKLKREMKENFAKIVFLSISKKRNTSWSPQSHFSLSLVYLHHYSIKHVCYLVSYLKHSIILYTERQY